MLGSACEERRAPGCGSALCPDVRLASAALATIPAAVAFTDFAANVFVLTSAAQATAVSALILGLLNHAWCRYTFSREGRGRGCRKSKDANAGSYHGSENY